MAQNLFTEGKWKEVSIWKKLFGTPEKPEEDVSIHALNSTEEATAGREDLWSDEPTTEQDEEVLPVSIPVEPVPPSEVSIAASTHAEAPTAVRDSETVEVVASTDVAETGTENVTQPEGQSNNSFDTHGKTFSSSDFPESSTVNLETITEPAPEPIDPELLAQEHEYLEDLTILDGRLLPELVVPDWRDELEFVKERYEPCDLTEHIVKVSKRRLTSRQIDHELAISRLKAYERYLERASRRFKDKIDEDAVLTESLRDLSQWKNDQAKSIAWRLAERVNEEVLKAKQAEIDATAFISSNIEFTNSEAVKRYRQFARRAFLIPLTTAYILSVVGLTYNEFEWIMKFLPLFNLGIANTMIMISGVASAFWLSNLWKYAKSVAKTQKQLSLFTSKHKQQYEQIKHAVKQHTRLAQQQPLVEPILQVLAKAYRVQLQSNATAKAQVTTAFDSASLPACVSIARAVDTDEEKMARLKKRALGVLMSPGWRTKGLDEIARIHADSKMIDANSLSLKSLDTDSLVSAANAQKLLLEAFENTSIHDRVSRQRLIRAIKDLHFEVLANWDSKDRPEVISLRDDGFSKVAFRTSWIDEEDISQDWKEFLNEILTEETAPFGVFNVHDRRSIINNSSKITSMAVVPHYFPEKEYGINVQRSSAKAVMPMDIVVRVDVSEWANASDFAVFADGVKPSLPEDEKSEIEISSEITGGTSV